VSSSLDPATTTPPLGTSPNAAASSTAHVPPILPAATYDPSADRHSPDPAVIGSPLKKQRNSTAGLDSEFRKRSAEALARGLGFGFNGPLGGKAGVGTGGKDELGGRLEEQQEKGKGEDQELQGRAETRTQPSKEEVKMEEEDEL
jgi:hypothetical protein